MKGHCYQRVLIVLLLAFVAIAVVLVGLADAGAHAKPATIAEPDMISRQSWTAAPTWLTYTVDASGGCWGQSVSLAFDDDGRPHVSFLKDEAWDLVYAVLDGGAWVTSTVDAAGNVGGANSIALDSLARPHIVYERNLFMDTRLQYAFWDGAQWQIQELTSDSGVVHNTAIAIDEADRVHLACQRSSSAEYQRIPGLPLESIGSSAGTGIGLAIDDMNRPHVTFVQDGNLKYAVRDDQGWTIETVESRKGQFMTGRDSRLALDKANNPHISYGRYTCDDFDCYGEQLAYATMSNGQWLTDTVVTEHNVGFSSSVAVSYYGLVSISYPHSPSGKVMLASGRANNWRFQEVDSETVIKPWFYTSLALDPGTGPGIAYCTADEIRFAWLPLNIHQQVYAPLVRR